MSKKPFSKFTRSLAKIILPLLFKILIKLKINRRVINYLNEKSYFSNNIHNFNMIIKDLLKDKKIISLDVGAQGGFNSDNFFHKRYEPFFEDILLEPIKSEFEKMPKKKYSICKGLWSSKKVKDLYILDNRLGSSSMYKIENKNFDLHNIKKKNYDDFKITRTIQVECDTLENVLTELNIESLDYLKIDTQGAEFEILQGLGKYRPLLIKVEAHIFSMYRDVPSWNNLINNLYKLNYVTVDWKEIGSHSTRVPAEMDMIFIQNFNNDEGKKIILNSKEKFISLMLIFGQLSLLKVIMQRLGLDYEKLKPFEDKYFN